MMADATDELSRSVHAFDGAMLDEAERAAEGGQRRGVDEPPMCNHAWGPLRSGAGRGEAFGGRGPAQGVD